jgi:hypothetical protein
LTVANWQKQIIFFKFSNVRSAEAARHVLMTDRLAKAGCKAVCN